MKLPTKLEQRIKEFQGVIDAPEYNGVIAALITEASSLPKMGISVDYNSNMGSRHESREDGFRIFIRMNGETGRGKVLLYDILHELGHYHDPVKLPLERQHDQALRREREQRAWEWADWKFNTYPELEADRAWYTDYKQQCLATYSTK